MFGEGNNIGLDVGSYSLKAVKLSGMAGSYTLESASVMKRPETGGAAPGGLGPLLKGFLKGERIKGRRAASAIAGSSLIYRHLYIPPMPDKDLLEAVRWEIRKETSIPASELICDYVVSGEAAGEEQRSLSVIAFASRRTDVEELMKDFEEAGLDLRVIGVVPTALHAVFDENNDWERGMNYAMLELGETQSMLVILKEKRIVFTRELTFGGRDITRSIAAALHVDDMEADEYKINHGMDIPEADAGKLRDVLHSLIERLCSEIHRSIDYYQAQFRGGPVGIIHLSGGSALLKGIDDFIGETLGLAVFVHDPFTKIKIPREMEASSLRAISPSLNVATGLALRTLW